MSSPMIYTKIANILKETKAISKTERNQQQGFKFRGIDNVMNELHEIFSKNEVFILQEVQAFTTENRITKNGGTNTFTRATIKFKYTTTDGSFVETINVGEAMDSGDKGMNKAMSIALKYSLLQMFLIPTEEQKDPDAEIPEETDYMAMAIQEIDGAQSIQTLTSIYNSYAMFQSNKDFVSRLSVKRKELEAHGAK
ncbi:MAG TPA: single-stranded DNA-binding protein [Bacteroides graminisolvens]|uniref:Single-stranded DNA-binding protein n=1 Tax=Bacteroides graminisolvens TaxID=477666 RepID=A0A3D2SCS7_9BACE|nr:single-stranded DNA-binding protein [Bacteroides graminisolvens]